MNEPEVGAECGNAARSDLCGGRPEPKGKGRPYRDHIMPGKPTQNGYIESFNGKLRSECMSISWFGSIAEAQVALDAWVRDYNEVRPHSALSNLAPLQYVARVIGTSVANLISP